MIHDQDRSGWIGASDTSMVMGSWDTKTFAQWWRVKLGVSQNNFTTIAMLAGTHYEHRILEAIGVKKMDRQIRVRKLRLRVNLDGETRDTVKEVKTYHGEKFKVSKQYWQQAQVEMFVTDKALHIVAYRLTDDEYRNFFLPIEIDRLSVHPVQYDPEWVNEQYLPRLRYLAGCLKKGAWPHEVPG